MVQICSFDNDKDGTEDFLPAQKKKKHQLPTLRPTKWETGNTLVALHSGIRLQDSRSDKVSIRVSRDWNSSSIESDSTSFLLNRSDQSFHASFGGRGDQGTTVQSGTFCISLYLDKGAIGKARKLTSQCRNRNHFQPSSPWLERLTRATNLEYLRPSPLWSSDFTLSYVPKASEERGRNWTYERREPCIFDQRLRRQLPQSSSMQSSCSHPAWGYNGLQNHISR